MRNAFVPARIISRLHVLRENSRRAIAARSAFTASMSEFRRFMRWTLLLAGLGLSWETVPATELRAWVFDPPTSATKLTGARALLEGAGFAVAPSTATELPAAGEADLIVLASFANRAADAPDFVEKNASALRRFVESGGVLLQLAQRDETQVPLPFLPEGVRACRGDACLDDVRVTAPGHPLLIGLGDKAGRIALPPHIKRDPSWHTFMEQRGGAVLLGADSVDDPVLIEAAAGRGRFLLSSLYFDRLYDAQGKLVAPAAYEAFARAFAHNLAVYVAAVKAGQARAVQVTPKPTPSAFVPGSWTIAVLPDTQHYSRAHPEVFEAQTRWIAANASALNIKYVLHLGDITHNNTPQEWAVARRAMSLLDGVVPYAIVGGNHDYRAKRQSPLNDYFPLSRYTGWPTFGGAMEPGKMDNTFHLFEAGGKKWIILALEYAPRDAVVAWANEVLAAHRDRQGILVTHAYLGSADTRISWKKDGHEPSRNRKPGRTPSDSNDGEDLWQRLVRRHSNLLMTVNGHEGRDGVARLTSVGDHGNLVHQTLVNYQKTPPLGGNGFLRLYEFLPDGQTIQARSYSPVWDTYRTDVQNQFILKMSPFFPTAGASNNATEQR